MLPLSVLAGVQNVAYSVQIIDINVLYDFQVLFDIRYLVTK